MDCILKKISEISAVSGDESQLRQYLITLIRDKCDELTVDSMGNVIAFKKGICDKYKILLGTHMDESGFIVSEITDAGFVKFKAVGKIEPRCIVSKKVIIGANKIKGIIGMKAIHLQKREERESAVKVEDLYIDIGAESKTEASELISLGDYITFDTEFGVFGDNIKGKALKRMGCVCLISSMDEKPIYDTWFVFSAQREIPSSIPGRGMRTAAFFIHPDYALIIDALSSEDVYKTEEKKISLGNGAIFSYSDKTSISDIDFVHSVKKHAENNGISFNESVSNVDSSVAVAVQTASVGTKTATVFIPGRYLNTPVSLMNKDDINAVSDICSIFVKESDVIIDGTFKKAYRN